MMLLIYETSAKLKFWLILTILIFGSTDVVEKSCISPFVFGSCSQVPWPSGASNKIIFVSFLGNRSRIFYGHFHSVRNSDWSQMQWSNENISQLFFGWLKDVRSYISKDFMVVSISTCCIWLQIYRLIDQIPPAVKCFTLNVQIWNFDFHF